MSVEPISTFYKHFEQNTFNTNITNIVHDKVQTILHAFHSTAQK